MTLEEELRAPLRDPELYDPEIEHLPESALHESEDSKERTFVPFLPIVLEYNPDGTPRMGLCGRDASGEKTLPEGLSSGNVLMPVTTGDDLHHPEYTPTMDRLAQEGHGASWYIFEPPTDINEHDRETWSES